MMNSIKLLLVSSAFLISVSLMAQVKVNPEIQKKFDIYIELSNQKKWDQAFDLMYPKLFTKVPKVDLVNLMTSMEADGLSLQMSNVKINSSTVEFHEGDETFVRIEYSADLSVQVAPNSLYDAPKSIAAMTEQFESSYGKTNVKWNEAGKKYMILSQKSMMAIKTNNQWYLVEINNDQKELMEYLFSDDVMNALVRTE